VDSAVLAGRVLVLLRFNFECGLARAVGKKKRNFAVFLDWITITFISSFLAVPPVLLFFLLKGELQPYF